MAIFLSQLAFFVNITVYMTSNTGCRFLANETKIINFNERQKHKLHFT